MKTNQTLTRGDQFEVGFAVEISFLLNHLAFVGLKLRNLFVFLLVLVNTDFFCVPADFEGKKVALSQTRHPMRKQSEGRGNASNRDSTQYMIISLQDFLICKPFLTSCVYSAIFP